MQLSDKQKENLRILREIELEFLEQEIVALQITFATHINELIERVYDAEDEYKKIGKEIDAAITLWNDNCSKMIDSIALQSYKVNLLNEDLLNNFEQTINELKIVAHYYHNSVNSICIRQSTNIFDLLEKMNTAVVQYDQLVTQEKARIAQNILVLEQYFACNGISIGNVKNETKNYLQKGRNSRNAQAIAEAKNKLASIVVFGGPHKNNNKNDDDNENSNNKQNHFKTTKEAIKAARDLGFEKTNYRSQGQPVFKKGNRYISPDIDSHNGGIWKMADSVKNLGSRTTRMGTYDAYLNRIGN
jgi:hypothetical protein